MGCCAGLAGDVHWWGAMMRIEIWCDGPAATKIENRRIPFLPIVPRCDGAGTLLSPVDTV